MTPSCFVAAHQCYVWTFICTWSCTDWMICQYFMVKSHAKKAHWIKKWERASEGEERDDESVCLASSELMQFWQKLTSHKIVASATWSLKQQFFTFFHESKNQPIMFSLLFPVQSCHFLLALFTAFGKMAK